MSNRLSIPNRYDFFFIFNLLLCFLLWALLCTYGRMFILDGDYPRAIAEYALIKGQCLDDKRIITGDSVTRDGIDPRILGNDILNVSLGASNPVELYYEIKDLHWCNRPPKVVYIAITPHHFMNDDGYWNSAVRYGLISQEAMREVRHASKELSTDMIYNQGKLSLDQKIIYWLKEHHSPLLYFPSIRNTLLNFRYNENILTYKHIVENQGYAAWDKIPTQPPFPDKPVPTKLSLEGIDKEFHANLLAELYFNKMLSWLDEQHIKVILFSMPISDISNEAMTKDYYNGFESFIRKTLANNHHVEFVGDILPVMPIRYFNDYSHMHGRGAYDWTQKIKPLLNSKQ